MDPNHPVIPTWPDSSRRKRTVKPRRPGEKHLQILRKIYHDETEIPSKARRERKIATLKEHAPSASQNLVIDTLKQRRRAILGVTDRDVKAWFQNRKRENRLREKSDGKSIQPSLSRKESNEHAEPFTSWRPNERQLEILRDVYNKGNGTPSQARRREIIEALSQHGLGSQKEIIDCTLQVHQPATGTITDRNVIEWLASRYQEEQLWEIGSLQSRASEVRGAVQLLETQLQIIKQLQFDEEKGSTDKEILEKIGVTIKNQDQPIAETNEILRCYIVTEDVAISRRRQREEQLETASDSNKVVQRISRRDMLEEDNSNTKMDQPIAVNISQLRDFIATENDRAIEDDEISIIREVMLGDRAMVLKFRLPHRPRSEARMREL